MLGRYRATLIVYTIIVAFFPENNLGLNFKKLSLLHSRTARVDDEVTKDCLPSIKLGKSVGSKV